MEPLHLALSVVSLLLACVPGSHGEGTICSIKQSTWVYTLEYCEQGCCGEWYDQYCCNNIPLIVGCTIGGILLICVIITIVCCLVKKKGHQGRVVQPIAPKPAATVYHTTNAGYGMQPMGAPAYGTPAYGTPAYGTPAYGTPGVQPQPAPGYNPNMPPPPAYNYSDPAYPPGTAQPPPPSQPQPPPPSGPPAQ